MDYPLKIPLFFLLQQDKDVILTLLKILFKKNLYTLRASRYCRVGQVGDFVAAISTRELSMLNGLVK